MDARRHGKEGALAVPWKIYKALITTFWFQTCHKRKQNRCHKTRFTGSKYTCTAIAAGALPHTPLRALTALPRPLPVLKGSASQQRIKWTGQEGREGTEEKNGLSGEGMERKWRT